MKPWFFVTFNITISHIFSENFIEVPLVAQKIRRFSPSILTIFTIFIDFSDILTFPCYKETNEASILKMMSPIIRLLNNCIKLYWYSISSSWNGKGGQINAHPPAPSRKNYKLLSKNPALLGLTRPCLQALSMLDLLVNNQIWFM